MGKQSDKTIKLYQLIDDLQSCARVMQIHAEHKPRLFIGIESQSRKAEKIAKDIQEHVQHNMRR